MKKKRYFAQNKHLKPELHRAKYFDTLEEAKAWLHENGGGTIKERDAGNVFDPLIGNVRTWGIVYDTEKEGASDNLEV